MADLIDPSKDPHEIIRWDEEKRRHIRNDGAELNDAENNIFYHLMTVGETEDERRRYWNGWACQNLSDEARATLAKDLELDPRDLRPLNPDEKNKVLDHLQKHLPKLQEIPKIPYELDFSNTYFPYGISAIKFYFPRSANFQTAQFEGFTTFQGAQFADWADFRTAQFADWADFQYAQFVRSAFFNKAQFKYRTDFQNTKFLKSTPLFYASEFHPDINFETGENAAKEFWPQITKENNEYEIRTAKNAYTELRRHMAALHKVEEEQFFHRQEMACQKHLEKKPMIKLFYWGYDKLSDYGWSFSKPLEGLLYTILISLFAYWLPLIKWGGARFDSLHGFLSSLALSITSTIPVLGARRVQYEKLLSDDGQTIPNGLMDWIYFAGFFQTALGILFIFLFALALRNRFRLR